MLTAETVKSFGNRALKLTVNRNTIVIPQAYGEMFGILFGATMLAGEAGFNIASIGTLPYVAWRVGTLQYRNYPLIGEFVSFRKAIALKNTELPDGTKIRFGEAFGKITAVNNLWEMSKLPIKERQLEVSLDATRFMSRLVRKIEDQDEDVRDLKAFKAKSHLVAQNPSLLNSFGFTVLPKKVTHLEDYRLKLDKLAFAAVFGTSRFIVTKDPSSFKNEVKLVKKVSQVAWATPDSLVKNKKNIKEEYERAKRVVEKFRQRS